MNKKEKKYFNINLVICIILLFVSVFSACIEIDGFEKHLVDAVTLNKERKKIYAEMTDGETDFLFTALIGFETALIPVAKTMDMQAVPFLKEGIPIIVNDFVPMESVNDYRQPSIYSGEMTDEALSDVKEIISRINRLKNDDLDKICNVVYEALLDLNYIEEKHQVHFQMTKHLLESLGYASLHAIQYNIDSEGRTDFLTKEFVLCQLLPFKTSASLFYDKMANPFHQMGIGVLINEVPYIPFVEEFEASR